jgi:hypothetical protein
VFCILDLRVNANTAARFAAAVYAVQHGYCWPGRNRRNRRAGKAAFSERDSMNDGAIARFAESLRGPVIGRSHPDYDEARKLYNGMIDKRPLLIARCADVTDVIGTVNFGRDSDLPIAIRGGTHGRFHAAQAI